MSRIKDWLIRWAIKQIVQQGNDYGRMRYLEDVVENEFGEKQFIFSHHLVPVNQAKLLAAAEALPSQTSLEGQTEPLPTESEGMDAK